MLGLVVTPTTLNSLINCFREPLTNLSRERSSNQIATPAFDRSSRTLAIDFSNTFFCCFNDVFDGETKLFEKQRRTSGCSKMF